MATAHHPPFRDVDPFARGVKTASLSWKDLPIGTVFTLQVLEPAKLLQSRDYQTDKPAFWDEEKTQPIMSAVVNVRVLVGPHSVGEDRSVWAQKPSDLFVAIAEAQKAAGSQITTGGVLHLKFTGETPHKNPKNNPIKNYAAKYEPPAPACDAFSAEAPVPPAREKYVQPAQQTRPARPAFMDTPPTQTPPGWPQPTVEKQPGNPNVAPLVRW